MGGAACPAKSIGGCTACGTSGTLSRNCSFGKGTAGGIHSTSLDSVLSSCNIQRHILLMCTTLDLCDLLCSICTVVGGLTLFTIHPPSHFGSNFQQNVGFCFWYVCHNVPFAALLPVLYDIPPCHHLNSEVAVI